VILLLLTLFLTPAVLAGEPVVDDFRAAFARAEAKIEKELPELAAEIRPFRLSDVEKTATIEGTDEILVVEAANGSQESVAVNEPAARRILINRARWAAVPSDLVKEAIALHELLSLGGGESTGAYPYSSRYLGKFGGRTDAGYLVAGRDPGIPAWKSLRISCEKRFEYIDRPTGRLHKDASFTLAAIANWKIRGKNYALQWDFGAEVEKLQTLFPFTQTITETLGADGAGKLYRLNERFVARSINDHFYYEKSPVTFVEEMNASRAHRFFYEKNRRGKLREQSTFAELADGSLRLVNKNLLPHPNKDVNTLVSQTECVLKRLPEGDWAALTGQPEITASFEDLNLLAKRANEAVLKPGYAAGTISPEEKAFLTAWDALYQKQIKKLDAVRYLPEKGVRGSVLAAGRKPKPVPKEIMDRTLKEVAEDTAKLRKQGKPYPYQSAARAKAAPVRRAPRAPDLGPVVTQPTFVKNPDGGPPVLRMPGQTLRLKAQERAAGRALDAYKRTQGYE
jgi:hypothetical protein